MQRGMLTADLSQKNGEEGDKDQPDVLWIAAALCLCYLRALGNVSNV